ncbi:hypothetical protein [Streptomyces sp. NPDC059909]|uniref:hypothetical protein n=1 Tax=Streptomyces sp. NPDC059909 TaxID=3346998 RepID=UPI00364E1C2B
MWGEREGRGDGGRLRPGLGEQALLGLGQDSAVGQPFELQADVVDVVALTRGIGDVIDHTVPGDRFGDGYFKGNQRTTRTPYKQATRDRVAAGLESVTA